VVLLILLPVLLVGQIHLLNHDIKRALSDSKGKNGVVCVTSMLATTSVLLVENDVGLQEGLFRHHFGLFKDLPDKPVQRRSHSAGDKHHFMASLAGLSLSVAFNLGKLSISPFVDVVAFDFDTNPGRREFLISVLSDNAPAPAKPAAPAAPRPA
jgi:thiamine phosphate synthase YjbQ (UPF0047 family)